MVLTCYFFFRYILGQYPCHGVLGDSQYFSFADEGSLRNEYMCADAADGKVHMYFCRDYGRNKKWHYDEATGQIRHGESGRCITAPDGGPSSELVLKDCKAGEESQAWTFEFKRQ